MLKDRWGREVLSLGFKGDRSRGMRNKLETEVVWGGDRWQGDTEEVG